METPTPRPKPAPPKVTEKTEFPGINMKSPDGTRVITVKDVKKAEDLTAKGWTLTTEKKTPYILPERMSARPFQDNPALQALQRSMKPKNTKRPSNKTRRNTKEKN